MSQSNVIAGALVIAFLIFITARGELPEYIGLFTRKQAVVKEEKAGWFEKTFGDGPSGWAETFSKVARAVSGDPTVIKDIAKDA